MESLGGYRLVRKVGDGPRAEVFFAHPEADESDDPPAAIKIYRSGTPHESVALEIETLSRAQGEHVVELLDLTAGPADLPALILGRLAGGSLDRLLAERPSLAPGEAVTLLAPLAHAVSRLHAAGVVHGAIRAESVLFDDSSTPVLACFGRATVILPGLPAAKLETDEGVLADLRAFEALAAVVLEGARIAAPSLPTSASLAVFADQLFELAEPLPVDLRSRRAARQLPNRVVTAPPIAEPLPTPSWLERLALPDWAAEFLPVVERVRGALAVVRPRVWAAAGAVGIALVAALLVVPQQGSGATASPSAAPTTPAVLPVDAGPVSGDDPVDALLALLEVRESCIRDLSVLCLDGVDQLGSAAMDADQELVRSLQQGAELPQGFDIDPEAVVIAERLGDSAIVDLGPDSEPASILLMKGEAGWRIRDYVER